MLSDKMFLPGDNAVSTKSQNQKLTCSFGNLGPEATRTIHVVSQTTLASCKTYKNTAHATARNHKSVEDSATITVKCPACPTRVYLVNDMSLADSQFLTLDPATLAISKLGPLYSNYDIEGIDLHPTTFTLYATAGSDNRHGQNGFLFKVDRSSGSLTIVGSTGYSEIVGLSFRPDGTLWGWSEGKGLIKINPSTAAASLIFSSSKNVEGLAWSLDGTKLYAVANKTLYVYNPSTSTLTQLAGNLPSKTEALELRPDGLLIGASDDSSKLFAYNVNTLQAVSSKSISVAPYNDIESIAWPECLAVGTQSTVKTTMKAADSSAKAWLDGGYDLAASSRAIRRLQLYNNR